MEEIWRPVLDGRYHVSSFGRIKRVVPSPGTQPGRIKALQLRNKYPSVHIPIGNRYKSYYVHGLVTAVFIGPCPTGKQVNHKNGIKTDNRVENLEYMTPKENMNHAYRTGLKISPKGKDHWKSKLDEKQAMEIINLHRAGVSPKEISKIFSISLSNISFIVNRKSWRHLDLGQKIKK